jgi:membrane-associated phospholipid phosphatase
MTDRRSIGFIAAAGVVLFNCVALIEVPYVLLLWQHSWDSFCDFMSRSVFESGSFGGSDIGVFIGIFAFFAWIMSKKFKKNILMLNASEWNFIWVSCLVIALLVVQSMKWIVSRARPKTLFASQDLSTIVADQYADLKWAGFMPLDGPRGYSWNSFPSGHTASCAMLLALSYIFWRRKRWQGYLTFALIVVFSFFMALARSMAGMHWLSDSVASFFIAWVLVHLLSEYFLSVR